MKLVSIIIPVYNGKNYIESAINSALVQSYTNIEVIIVDDGSVDGTSDTLKTISVDNRCKVFSFETNRGKVAAINHGFLKSTGDIIMILAADDVLPIDSVSIRVHNLNTNKANYCNMKICDENLNFRADFYTNKALFLEWKKNAKDALWKTVMSGGSLMFNREIATKVFPIPEILKFEDLWLSIFVLYYAERVDFINIPLYFYRIHGNNDNAVLDTSNSDIQIKKDYIRHIDVYMELEKTFQSRDIVNKKAILKTIKQNMKVKTAVVKGKVPPLYFKYVLNYGLREYFKMAFISYGITNKIRKVLNKKY